MKVQVHKITLYWVVHPLAHFWTFNKSPSTCREENRFLYHQLPFHVRSIHVIKTYIEQDPRPTLLYRCYKEKKRLLTTCLSVAGATLGGKPNTVQATTWRGRVVTCTGPALGASSTGLCAGAQSSPLTPVAVHSFNSHKTKQTGQGEAAFSPIRWPQMFSLMRSVKTFFLTKEIFISDQSP